jgi:hypothetical protein
MRINLKSIKMKRTIPAVAICLALLTGCVEEANNPLDGVGSSFLRLGLLTDISDVIGFNVGVTAMDASPHTQTSFIVHRDAVSNADLNKSVTVDFALDPTYLTTYNQAAQHVYDTARVNDSTRVYQATYAENMQFTDANGQLVQITANNYDSLHTADPNTWDGATLADWIAEVVDYSKSQGSIKGAAYAAQTAPVKYEILPETVYSFTGDGVSGNTITFAAGETTKELKINIDPSTLSFTTNYALPLTVLNPSGSYKVSNANIQLINQIIVKNQYDGVYTYEGFIGRWDGAGTNDPSLGGPIKSGATITVITAGSTTDTFQLMWATAASGIGGIGSAQQITVNADNTINLTPIGAAPLNWGPIAGKDNKYDPASKTFTINWRWSGTDPVSTSGYKREVMVTMKYKSPR